MEGEATSCSRESVAFLCGLPLTAAHLSPRRASDADAADVESVGGSGAFSPTTHSPRVDDDSLSLFWRRLRRHLASLPPAGVMSIVEALAAELLPPPDRAQLRAAYAERRRSSTSSAPVSELSLRSAGRFSLSEKCGSGDRLDMVRLQSMSALHNASTSVLLSPPSMSPLNHSALTTCPANTPWSPLGAARPPLVPVSSTPDASKSLGSRPSNDGSRPSFEDTLARFDARHDKPAPRPFATPTMSPQLVPLTMSPPRALAPDVGPLAPEQPPVEQGAEQRAAVGWDDAGVPDGSTSSVGIPSALQSAANPHRSSSRMREAIQRAQSPLSDDLLTPPASLEATARATDGYASFLNVVSIIVDDDELVGSPAGQPRQRSRSFGRPPRSPGLRGMKPASDAGSPCNASLTSPPNTSAAPGAAPGPLDFAMFADPDESASAKTPSQRPVSGTSPSALCEFEPPPMSPMGASRSAAMSPMGGSRTRRRSDSFTHSRSALFATDDDGNETVNGYTLWQELGRGAAGVVHLAFSADENHTRAIKTVLRAQAGQPTVAGLLSEAAIMKKLNHQNVVQLYECIDDPAADAVYLVMQYVPDGPIAKLSDDGTCAPLPLGTVAHYTKQLAAALQYMHKKKVTHGDIKPDNILVDNGSRTAYFSDFGVSRAFAVRRSAGRGSRNSAAYNQRAREAVVARAARRDDSPPTAPNLGDSMTSAARCLGTPGFLSPEVFEGDPPGTEADMWAMGVTLFVMVYGKLPFKGSSYFGVKKSVVDGELRFPPAMPAARPWIGVISALLHKDPAQRMTAKQLARAPALSAEYPMPLGRAEAALATASDSGTASSLGSAWSPANTVLPMATAVIAVPLLE
jgi:serine/threonine protein kinase